MSELLPTIVAVFFMTFSCAVAIEAMTAVRRHW